jgi:hypothetical protein
MKKFFCGFIAVALFIPLLAVAVTWTGDSNQFRWTDGTPALMSNQLAPSPITLQCRSGFLNGSVTFLYNLPSRAPGAKLTIFNVSGALVKSFHLEPGVGSVHWSFVKDRAAAGVYVASMRYGTVDKKIQIAIVK